MKYLVRPNPKAYNPITGQIDPQRLWEVEQCAWDGGAGHDSEKVLWHCAAVNVNGQTIEPTGEVAFHGICTRDHDNAISIREGRNDVS